MASDTVLVIGTNLTDRDVLTRTVKDIGHPVLAVGSLQDGLALLSSLRPKAILVDLDDTEAGALDLIQQIRLESLEAPLVAVSSTNDSALAVKAVRAGACDFLVKPLLPQTLREAIKRGFAQNGGNPALSAASTSVAESDRSSHNLELLFRGSERMHAVEDIVRRAADTNVTVLINGESGVGKEMAARAIHQISGRLDKPFVTNPFPPLRTRREEIPALTPYLLSKFCLRYEREMPAISSETMRLFQEYSWPGNVRELENMIRRLVVLQSEALVQEEIALRTEKPQYDMTPHGPGLAKSAAALRGGRDLGLKDIAKKAAMAAEAAAIKDVLERVRWNRAETARLLKISYKALLYKIRQCGLDGHKTDGRGK